MSAKTITEKKLTGGIATIIVLTICLCITTFALVYATVSADNNLFHTGKVVLNLNDGEPVINEHEFLFEPGMTVKKDFFLENESTWDVYYKFYLTDVEGGLADVLQIAIVDGDKVLCSGTANELTRDAVQPVDDVLKIKERRNLSIYFYFPPESGNEAQLLDLTFTLAADGTQTKNNPNKLFD